MLQIGLGDFVPGQAGRVTDSVDMQLYVDYCYLLGGLAIVAMNYYMLKEEVLHKSLIIKRKISTICDKVKTMLDKETVLS